MRRIHWLFTAIILVAAFATGCSSDNNSPAAPIVEDLTAPAAPVNLSAQVTESAIAVSWTANTEVDLDNYSLYKSVNHGEWQYVCDCSSATFQDHAPPRSLTHISYRVSAVDHTGNQSAFSAPLSISFDAGDEPNAASLDW